ncbi:phosphotransferase [Stutzerimonas xanthomarina]|uniref:phosphotransferase n=1 Tax=Stutzerimonas xanthomarina TaxID=271420 RepID=UPI003AA900B9
MTISRVRRFEETQSYNEWEAWVRRVDGCLHDFAPDRAVAVVFDGDAPVFVKRMRFPVKRWWKRFLRRPRECPLYKESKWLDTLSRFMSNMPRPIYYCQRRVNGQREVLLVISYVDGTVLAMANGDQLRAQANGAAVALAGLHNLGISHGDAHLYNVMVSDTGLQFIDFERAGPLSPDSALDDLRKLLAHLFASGLEAGQIIVVAQAYESALQRPPLFDVADCVRQAFEAAGRRKETRWRQPQVIRLIR